MGTVLEVTQKPILRDAKGRLLPGSGTPNPEGRRREASAEFREYCRRYDKEAVDGLMEIARDRDANAMARVRAYEAVISRGHGAPAPAVDGGLGAILAAGVTGIRFRLSEAEVDVEQTALEAGPQLVDEQVKEGVK